MRASVVVSSGSNPTESLVTRTAAVTWATVAGCALILASCASEPDHSAQTAGGRYFDARLGVWASPRLVADGQPVPRGGGGYLVGRPYVIGGQTYYPNAEPRGYTVVGTASWYGDAFHGRRTANGEIFDKGSVSAAHPTLPLPSYVRVTNLKNSRSMIVRVNDRGPYHGGRVMDVSQRVAEALDFKSAGTARIRVEYIGRASLAGSDDEHLIATLRLDGGPAQLAGVSDSEPSRVAALTTPAPEPAPATPAPIPARLPLLPAARVSRVSLREPPTLFGPPSGVRPPTGPRPPGRPSLVLALPAGLEASSPPVSVEAPAKRVVHRVVAAPRPPLRPLFPDPAQGDDSAEVAPANR